MLISFLIAAFLAGAPLILATVGEILTEKSGNVNLGVEGTMYIGAIAGLAGSVTAEEAGFAGVGAAVCAFLAALAAGMLISLVFCFMTINLHANQNVVGLTITILGTGMGNFFGEIMGQNAGGYISVSARTKAAFGNLSFGVLTEIPVLGKLLFNYNWMVYLSFAVAVICYIFLFKTRRGLKMVAVGENPAAADAAGISVSKNRYFATVTGGGLCALAGMYMCMVNNSGVWVHDCISGYGWLAVALVIFSMWNPLRAILCSIIFGALMIMRMYISIPGLNSFIYDMCPYIVTAFVIIMISMSKKKNMGMPEASGLNYFREER